MANPKQFNHIVLIFLYASVSSIFLHFVDGRVIADDGDDGRVGGGSQVTDARNPFGFNLGPQYGGGSAFAAARKQCPLCDSSVYSYCSDRLFHDACCCNNPYDTTLPHQCRFADCSFLHANSCREHRLITSCCCSNLYLARSKQ